MTSFVSLGVPENLASVLAADGKTEAFPIQADTLPDSLGGRDVLGRGRTGSGKTIAFALPLVARLAAASTRTARRHPRGLVLAPTRELATQIADTVRPLADAAGLTVTTIFGGVSQRPQERALDSGVDIVVACPGRLEDLMHQGVVSLDAVQVTVLDEADHMADLGFLPGVTRILAATAAGGQRMLFSATLDHGIDKLVKRFLHDARLHEVDDASVPQGVMVHRVFAVADKDAKTALVQRLASGQGRRILFTRTKHHAKKLARKLTAAGIPAVDLQGNLSQNARDRNMHAFHAEVEDGGVRVLVATDIAARGVHVDHVELVVHVDPPVEHKAYLHRSGRTARAGEQGTVVTVMLPEERRDVADLLRKARIRVTPEQVTDAAVDALVGEPAPYVKPAPAAAPQQTAKAGSGRGSRSRGRGAQQRGTTPQKTRGAGHDTQNAPHGAPRTGDSVRGGHAAGHDAPSRGQGQGQGRGRGSRAKGGARSAQPTRSAAPAPQSGRTASGRPTVGATVGSLRSHGPRRASRPAGR